MTAAAALLAEDEPPPYEPFNPEGAAPILLICDHASRRVPRRLNDLGLDQRESRKSLPPRFHADSPSFPATGD
jgi:predicted N-formylglutamate amidohydrolase